MTLHCSQQGTTCSRPRMSRSKRHHTVLTPFSVLVTVCVLLAVAGGAQGLQVPVDGARAAGRRRRDAYLGSR
eukprot:4533237-Pyramimonas_sp.AAC.1